MKIINGSVWDLNGFSKRDLTIRDDRISNNADHASDEDMIDAEGMYVIPGLVDIHFHGASWV